MKALVSASRGWHSYGRRLALISPRRTLTNDGLGRVAPRELAWEILTPGRALEDLRHGDAALGRLDVLPTLAAWTTASGRWARSPLEEW